MTTDPTLDRLTRLALEAGREIMAIYESGDLGTEAKADASPVTAADLAADRLIAAGLAEAFPEVPAVTEEQAFTHAQAGHPRFFLVDPLDGTKEFVRRGGDFTVNIALVVDGRPVAGVVYAPAKGRLFAGRVGDGATETPVADGVPSGPARPIAVRRPGERLSVVASKSHRDAATDEYIARYPVEDFVSAGSSLKFCLLAAGEADLYPRLGRTMEWDTAAGHAVLAAAGGTVVRFEDHAPFTYGKPGYANGFFIAHVPGVRLVSP